MKKSNFIKNVAILCLAVSGHVFAQSDDLAADTSKVKIDPVVLQTKKSFRFNGLHHANSDKDDNYILFFRETYKNGNLKTGVTMHFNDVNRNDTLERNEMEAVFMYQKTYIYPHQRKQSFIILGTENDTSSYEHSFGYQIAGPGSPRLYESFNRTTFMETDGGFEETIKNVKPYSIRQAQKDITEKLYGKAQPIPKAVLDNLERFHKKPNLN